MLQSSESIVLDVGLLPADKENTDRLCSEARQLTLCEEWH